MTTKILCSHDNLIKSSRKPKKNGNNFEFCKDCKKNIEFCDDCGGMIDKKLYDSVQDFDGFCQNLDVMDGGCNEINWDEVHVDSRTAEIVGNEC